MKVDPKKQQVRLADGTFWSVANLASDVGQRVLKRLKASVGPGKPVAYCTCRDIQPAEFAAPKRTSLTLRTFPRQAHRHDPSCYFAPGLDHSFGASGDTVPVVVERGNLLHVRLANGVHVRNPITPAAPQSPTSPRTAPARVQQRPISLYHLFDLIWERADLTVWHPGFAGKRNASLVAHLVMDQLKHFAYNRKGQTLADISAVVLHERQSGDLDMLWNRSHDERFRPLLLTTLNRTVPALSPKPGWNSVLLPAPALKMSATPVQIDFGFYERLVNQFTVGRRVNCRRLALLQLEPAQNRRGTYKFFKVCDAVFRAVSDEYLPVDSGHELAVTNSLVAENRHFRKPLNISPFEYLPDFILYDTLQVNYPMEVFGMNTDDYLAHRAEKTAYYDTLLGSDGWWQWSPLESTVIPPFPQARPTHRT